MTIESRIAELEQKLGFQLPDDYRRFLISHEQPLLDPVLAFDNPVPGVIDELLTVDRILENDANGTIGIPEKSLLHIGGNLMGGCLYLKVSQIGFGEVHYMEDCIFRGAFPCFAEFLRRSHGLAQSDPRPPTP